MKEAGGSCFPHHAPPQNLVGISVALCFVLSTYVCVAGVDQQLCLYSRGVNSYLHGSRGVYCVAKVTTSVDMHHQTHKAFCPES